jgi:septum formation protein
MSERTLPLLVLASASPRRKALLAQAGLAAGRIAAPAIDETPRPRELPRAHAERLAREKALAVAAQCAANEVVLAADTVVALGRRILPKAADAQSVRACLALLSGRRHVVYTAIAVARGGALHQRVAATRVAFKPLSDAEIAAYAACGEGEGKAGGYAIQGRAEAFVRFINGSYSNVVGLPLRETLGLLRAAGLDLAD